MPYSLLSESIRLEIVQHALDNGVRNADYQILGELEVPKSVRLLSPTPCEILPRQFGFWFNTGPGFSAPDIVTYRHRLVEVLDAWVLGQDGVPVYAQGWVDTAALNYVRWHLNGCQVERIDGGIATRSPSRQIRGSVFIGFNAGHNNYAHFVTDQLPLLYYYKIHLAPLGIKLLLPTDQAPFFREYIQLLDVPSELVELIGDEVVSVERLIHPSVFSFDAIPLSVVDLLKAFRNEVPSAVGAARRRLFVSRKDAPARTLLNERALEKLLAAQGYETLVPGTLSVADQIAAFRNAECVVAAHGAALANIVFCEPGTRIVELFPEYTVSPHFWVLASHFDLSYGTVIGTSFDQDHALQDQSGSWEGAFVISEAALLRAL